jgi:hypothetical protein
MLAAASENFRGRSANVLSPGFLCMTLLCAAIPVSFYCSGVFRVYGVHLLAIQMVFTMFMMSWQFVLQERRNVPSWTALLEALFDPLSKDSFVSKPTMFLRATAATFVIILVVILGLAVGRINVAENRCYFGF